MKQRNSRFNTGMKYVTILLILILVFTINLILGYGKSGTNDDDFDTLSTQESEPATDKPTIEVSITPDVELPKNDEPEVPLETEDVDIQPEFRINIISDKNPELSSDLDDTAKKYNCVAASLAFYNGEYDYFTYQYGQNDLDEFVPVDVETKFWAGSLSKLTTVICAMTLVDAGELDLDTDISTYLGYEVKNPKHPDVPITSQMLMHHISSIYDSEAYNTSRNGNSSSSNRQLLDAGTSYMGYRPGGGYIYSNLSYSILGAVCEMISGKTIDTFAHELLFVPLGIDAGYVPNKMQDTTEIAAIYNNRHTRIYSAQDQLDIVESEELGHDHHLAHCNLTISALDYARILAMLTNGGILDGVRILTEEAVEKINTTNYSTERYDQRLGVRFLENGFMDEDVFWHTGSGFGTFAQFIYNMETKRAVVVITTGSNTTRTPNGMVSVCSDLSEPVWKSFTP